MRCLSDDDFAPLVDDEEFTSLPALRAAVPQECMIVGVPRCVCGQVIGGISGRVAQVLDQRLYEERRRTGTQITQATYEALIERTIAEESDRVLGPCCKSMIESMPRVTVSKHEFIERPIEESERLLALPDTKRKGNTIVTSFAARHYNPYTYVDERIVATVTDDPEALELEEIRKHAGLAPLTTDISPYPNMPFIAPDDGFELEEVDLYKDIATEYIIHGRSYTGVEGYSVPLIRTKITAR